MKKQLLEKLAQGQSPAPNRILYVAIALISGLVLLGKLANPAQAADTFTFVQEALTRGLDRLREPPSAAAIPLDTTASNLPYGVFFGDFDGDGLLDTYALNHGQVPHRSGLWINNGAGGFNPNIYTVALISQFSAYLNNTGWMYSPTDLNGDGRPDLYFGGWNSYAVDCYNRGVTVQSDWTGPRFECRPATYPTALADVNSDGKTDIQTYANPNVSDFNYLSVLRKLPLVWKLNNGSENTTAWPSATGTDFDFIRSASPGTILDLDVDGLPDKVEGIPVASSQRGSYALSSGGLIFSFGQADRTYAVRTTGLESEKNPLASIEDVNRDGCRDLGFDATAYRDNQYWYLQNKLADGRCAGTWHWVGRTSSELPHFMGASRQQVDLDNSGAPLDIIFVKTEYGNNAGYSGGIHVFKQQPNGTWAEVLGHGINLGSAYYSSMSFGDWNNDGRPDVAAQGATTQPGTDKGISLFTNTSVNGNTWIKVHLPELSGFFTGAATIEMYESGQAGNPAAKVGQTVNVRTGRHWPSTRYHLGAGPRASVDVRVTFPDGSVVVTNTPTNRLVQISSVPNTPPTAVIVVTAGPNATSFNFDGSGSSDPDGSIAAYSWAFGDGGTSSGASTSHTYATPGTYTATLTVTDNRGAIGTATTQVIVPDVTPPVMSSLRLTIEAPVTDNKAVSRVEFYLDSVLTATINTAPYRFLLDTGSLSTGSHTVEGRAFDAAGNTSSETIGVVK